MTRLDPFDTAEVVAQVIVVGSFVAVPAAPLLLLRRRGVVIEPG